MKLVAVWEREARGKTPPLPVASSTSSSCAASPVRRWPRRTSRPRRPVVPLPGLPELSPSRVSGYELERLLAHHRDPSLPTEWD